MANPLIGTVSALVGGTITLLMPVRCNYWFIQNQGGFGLRVRFKIGSRWGNFTSIVLNPGPASVESGPAGGLLTSIGFPYFDDLTLESVDNADPMAAFGSGASPVLPCNVFPYPGNQNFLNGVVPG